MDRNSSDKTREWVTFQRRSIVDSGDDFGDFFTSDIPEITVQASIPNDDGSPFNSHPVQNTLDDSRPNFDGTGLVASEGSKDRDSAKDPYYIRCGTGDNDPKFSVQAPSSPISSDHWSHDNDKLPDPCDFDVSFFERDFKWMNDEDHENTIDQPSKPTDRDSVYDDLLVASTEPQPITFLDDEFQWLNGIATIPNTKTVDKPTPQGSHQSVEERNEINDSCLLTTKPNLAGSVQSINLLHSHSTYNISSAKASSLLASNEDFSASLLLTTEGEEPILTPALCVSGAIDAWEKLKRADNSWTLMVRTPVPQQMRKNRSGGPNSSVYWHALQKITESSNQRSWIRSKVKLVFPGEKQESFQLRLHCITSSLSTPLSSASMMTPVESSLALGDNREVGGISSMPFTSITLNAQYSISDIDTQRLDGNFASMSHETIFTLKIFKKEAIMSNLSNPLSSAHGFLRRISRLQKLNQPHQRANNSQSTSIHSGIKFEIVKFGSSDRTILEKIKNVLEDIFFREILNLDFDVIPSEPSPACGYVEVRIVYEVFECKIINNNNNINSNNNNNNNNNSNASFREDGADLGDQSRRSVSVDTTTTMMLALSRSFIYRLRVFATSVVACGTAVVQVSLNDKKKRGTEVVAREDIIDILKETWIEYADVELSPWVDRETYLADGFLKFAVPHRNRLELLRMHRQLPSNFNAPLQVNCSFTEYDGQLTIRVDCSAIQLIENDRKLNRVAPVENIEIHVPIPLDFRESLYIPGGLNNNETSDIGTSSSRATGVGRRRSFMENARSRTGIDRLFRRTDSSTSIHPTSCGAGHQLPGSRMRTTVGRATYHDCYKAVVWRIKRLPRRNEALFTQHSLLLGLTGCDVTNTCIRKFVNEDGRCPQLLVKFYTRSSISPTCQVRSITIQDSKGRRVGCDKSVKSRCLFSFSVRASVSALDEHTKNDRKQDSGQDILSGGIGDLSEDIWTDTSSRAGSDVACSEGERGSSSDWSDDNFEAFSIRPDKS